jgi:hypothetical protein
VDSVKDAPYECLPKKATSPKMVEKVNDLIAADARFTTRYMYIAKCVAISVGAAHALLRRDLKMIRKVTDGYSISFQKSKNSLGKESPNNC